MYRYSFLQVKYSSLCFGINRCHSANLSNEVYPYILYFSLIKCELTFLYQAMPYLIIFCDIRYTYTLSPFLHSKPESLFLSIWPFQSDRISSEVNPYLSYFITCITAMVLTFLHRRFSITFFLNKNQIVLFDIKPQSYLNRPQKTHNIAQISVYYAQTNYGVLSQNFGEVQTCRIPDTIMQRAHKSAPILATRALLQYSK